MPATATTAVTSRGEVQKIDQDSGGLAIRQGERGNVGMPAMTRVFDMADRVALARLMTGDKIPFTANNAHG